MAEVNMPAAEAAVAHARDDEHASYEFAFHVLPTVAEGEVASVFETLKEVITKAGGEIFAEEKPQRIELAYDIVKHLEGKNRSFHSAYFGWVRFTIEPEKLPALTEAMEHRTEVLRHLFIRLTRQEEAMPFRYHEAQREQKIRTVEGREITVPKEEEEGGEVSDEKLDESLERITDDEDVADEKSDSIEETTDENTKS